MSTFINAYLKNNPQVVESYVDTHPDASMNECAQQINACFYEMAIEEATISSRLNSEVIHGLNESAQTGRHIDMKDIIDEANEEVAAKKQSIFEKIAAWLNSLIAKIQTFITSMNSRRKYIDNNAANFVQGMRKNGSVVIKGYPFRDLTGGSLDFSSLEINTLDDLNKAAGIDQSGTQEASGAKAAIDSWAAEKLRAVGAKTDGDFKENLKRALYGADAPAELALSTFNPQRVIDHLRKAPTIRECDKKYRNMVKVVRDAANKSKATATAAKNPDENGEAKAPADVSSVQQAALNEYSAILAIIFAYGRAAMQQAWTIFKTALNGKGENAAEGDKKAEQKKPEAKTEQKRGNQNKANPPKVINLGGPTNEEASMFMESSDDISDDDFDFDI